MERSPAALVCDRDGSVRDLVRNALEERGIMTLGAESCAEAVQLLNDSEVELLFVDLEAPSSPLAGVMARASALSPKPLVIGLVSAEGETERPVNMDAGIFDLFSKPLLAGLLSYRLERALRHLELLRATERLRRELQTREGFHGLVGRCAPMSRLRERIELLSASDGPVWFYGEVGSGKELAARTLHRGSARAALPFTVVDCSGEQPGLDENMEGTIYLAEAPALPLELQDRLLAMLSSGPQEGSDEELLPSPGPRILAGSSQDPHEAVRQGRLLPVLHERLAETALRLPPVRERSDDIALLAQHFVSTIRRINQLPPIRISEEALVLLESYRWRGNVRELRNTMERAVILAVDGTIQAHDLPRTVREQPDRDQAAAGKLSEQRFKEAKQEIVGAFERAYLIELMRRFGGNVTAASRHAGMLRSALQRLLRKYALKSLDFRKRRARSSARKGAEKALE